MTTSARKNTITKDENYVAYPRRNLWRGGIHAFMQVALPVLLRMKVTGRRHIPPPENGPLIIVSNHTALMEVAMIWKQMGFQQVEFLATGDIPLEPRYSKWGDLYGYIPVKRGSMDRKAMTRALSVLEQGGVVGLFPQGGIWQTTVDSAHTGVAWLSNKGNAPVLPIGFGGTAGSIKRAFNGERPFIEMNIGELISPAPSQIENLSRKETLEANTARVMEAVYDLIPQWEKDSWQQITDEAFELSLELTHRSDGHRANGTAPSVTEGKALAKFFHRPVLLDAFRRNLDLPVGPLEDLRSERDGAAMAAAIESIMTYVESDNPYFFTYRFGNEEGHAIERGLAELRDVARWAADNGYTVHVKPTRRYREGTDGEVLVQPYPEVVKSM